MSQAEGFSCEKGRNLWASLWRIYRRRQPPTPFVDGETFPWSDPDFGRRMLQLHLDQTHGAASRPLNEIELQVGYLMEALHLSPGDRLLDATCGPGLYACMFARRGISVVGFDISPVSLDYASERCRGNDVAFYLADVLRPAVAANSFDASLLLYGQFAVMPRERAIEAMERLGGALKPGGRLAIELLDPEKVDRGESNWWFTDDTGLWGDSPYLHLGERHWDEHLQASIERYYIVDLTTGKTDEYTLADQVYTPSEIDKMAKATGLQLEFVQKAWGGLDLSDAEEWILYVLRKPE